MSTKTLLRYAILMLAALLTACVAPVAVPDRPEMPRNQETLWQTSTLSALLAGLYDGDLTIAELKSHGDFGLGTFNALDGEMMVIDGEVYQVKSDGVAYLADDTGQTPFAVVTFFAADQGLSVSESMTCAKLEDHLDAFLSTANAPNALKITGAFATLKTRAPRKQSKPYPPLSDALANQAVFEFQNVIGSMLGFRLPSYMQGANSVGYHFHFLTEDRQEGGHVLDCLVQDVEIEIDASDAVHLDVPQSAAFQQAILAQSEADGQSLAPEPLVLAAIYNLTGSQAGLYVPFAQGAELAVAEAN